MINADQIKQQIEQGLDTVEVLVRLEGSKCELAVASSQFEGLRTLKKQQLIYACLNELIASGDLHAVTMHTYTPSEWETQKKLGIPGF